MKHTPQSIEQFLRAFERSRHPDDIGRIASCFAETFLVASPDGARAVRAADFALALPKRQKMLEEWGCQSTKLASVRVTALDSRYATAETSWLMSFAHSNGELSDVLVGSTFVLDTESECKILFYLTHQDLATVLRERGILQA